MLVPIALHAIYTVDFFVNEDWQVKNFRLEEIGILTSVLRYLSTIDICHDHFGFSLAWGPAAWLPMIYTCQTQYLASAPVELPYWCSAAIFVVGLAGYVIFRSSNHQKYLVRQSHNKCLIWGKKPNVIKSQYITADGSTHNSLLLCSGMFFPSKCLVLI